MKFDNLKQDKGVAGLTILLSLVTMLFVIGLLAMIFTIMGAEMSESVYGEGVGAVVEETVVPTTAGTDMDNDPLRDVSCTVVDVRNSTATTGEVISSGNYSVVSGCALANLTGYFDLGDGDGQSWIVNYTYTYSSDTTATIVMNDTAVSIGSVTDWFPIFIVISAMVVLILLTVIIITAIRGSGLMGVTSSAGNVGSA